MRPIWIIGCFFIGLQAIASTLPTPDELLGQYEEELNRISKQIDTRLGSEKETWSNAITAFRDEARLFGNVSDWMWAERMIRLTENMGGNWIGLFAEELKAAEGIQTLKEESHRRVKEIRSSAKRQTSETVKGYQEKFTLLEKRLVQANRIEEALKCNEKAARVEKSKPKQALEHKLKRLEARTYWKQDRKRRNRERKDLESMGAPPDASFPFLASNPAYEHLVNSVKVTSAGKAAGPASGIKIGRLITYTGTRGLAVVAVFNQEILIEDTFDTYAELRESERLIKAVKELPFGTFVVMAVRDDATRRFSGSAQSTLKRLGAMKGLQEHSYQGAYVLIGAKGLVPGQAIEGHDSQKISFPNQP